jgi:hypothetical protein
LSAIKLGGVMLCLGLIPAEFHKFDARL